MALKSVKQLFDSERADNNGLFQVYLVEYDTAAEFTLWQARSANDGTTRVPADGEFLTGTGMPSLTSLRVTNKTATRLKESPNVARVEVTWSVPQWGAGGKPDGAGKKWSVTLKSSGVQFTEPVSKDRGDKPILMSNGLPPDPYPTKEFYDEQFDIGYTTDDPEADTIADLRGKVNQDDVTLTIKGHTRTFPAETLKFTGTYENTVGNEGVEYWRVSIALLFRKDGWSRRFVDMGFYELAGGVLVPIADDNGDPIAQPAYLNGSGAQLAPGADAFLNEADLDETGDFNSFLTGIS